MLNRFRLALPVVALAILWSCGGGGSNFAVSGNRSGQATINVNWPSVSRSRLIPAESVSLIAKFTDSNNHLQSTTVIPRPDAGGTSVTKIKNLPVGDLTLEVTASPNPDGSGTAQARGSTKVKIEADKDTPVPITPVSTIVRISLDSGGSFALPVGGSRDLNESCFDAANALVLIGTTTEKWQSSDSSVATVDFAGTVRGVKNGKATIKFTETESGVSAEAVVTVADTTTPTPIPSR